MRRQPRVDRRGPPPGAARLGTRHLRHDGHVRPSCRRLLVLLVVGQLPRREAAHLGLGPRVLPARCGIARRSAAVSRPTHLRTRLRLPRRRTARNRPHTDGAPGSIAPGLRCPPRPALVEDRSPEMSRMRKQSRTTHGGSRGSSGKAGRMATLMRLAAGALAWLADRTERRAGRTQPKPPPPRIRTERLQPAGRRIQTLRVRTSDTQAPTRGRAPRAANPVTRGTKDRKAKLPLATANPATRGTKDRKVKSPRATAATRSRPSP